MKTGIEVKTSFFPLAFFLFFVAPTIEINGEKYKEKWGKKFFKLEPGNYLIKISFPYMGKKECGANQVKISLAEGEQKTIMYHMPPWMLSKGKITVI